MINCMDIEEKMDEFLLSLPCTSNIPYPEIKIKEKNIEYANMLLNAYSKNCNSELQAISQYMYHHFTISNKEVGCAMLCIALVEMKHLEVLADLINDLGGKPRFYNSNMHWFDSGNVAYADKLKGKDEHDDDNLCEKLKLDLLSERHAIQDYKLLIDLIDDECVKAVLKKILSDEMVHAEIFKNLIKKYCM